MGSHPQENKFKNSALESTFTGSSDCTSHFENIKTNLFPINSINEELYRPDLKFSLWKTKWYWLPTFFPKAINSIFK